MTYVAVGVGGWLVLLAAFMGRRWWVTRKRHVDNNGTVHYGGGMVRRLQD